jgi:tetratricopeptide (TPR) repeat protein
LYGTNHEAVAKTNYLIAQVYWNQGKLVEAEPYCTKALDIYQRVLGDDHKKVAKCLTGLGELWIEKDPHKAKPLLERSMEINIKIVGKEHHLVSRLLHDLATIHDSFGEHDEAVKLHLQAIAIREKVHPSIE